jgi:hypothetical protein
MGKQGRSDLKKKRPPTTVHRRTVGDVTIKVIESDGFFAIETSRPDTHESTLGPFHSLQRALQVSRQCVQDEMARARRQRGLTRGPPAAHLYPAPAKAKASNVRYAPSFIPGDDRGPDHGKGPLKPALRSRSSGLKASASFPVECRFLESQPSLQQKLFQDRNRPNLLPTSGAW